MRTALRNFDTGVAQQVAKLPRNLQRPFHYLGFVTPPVAWLAVVILYAYVVLPASISLLRPNLVLLALPLAMLSKFVIRRQRPPTIYAGSMRIKSYSFPSSHAFAAAIGAGYFAGEAWTRGWPLLSAALIAFGLIIGISRVYLEAHYPSDVLAGWLFGATLLGGILLCS